MKAIFALTGDPFSIEHKYIVKTAAEMFDEVYVLIAHNLTKTTMFTIEERIDIAKLSCFGLPNVQVAATNGLIVDVAKKLGVQRLVRGLRYTTEYEYELSMATWNMKIGDIKTIGIFSRDMGISSTGIRELITFDNSKWKDFIDPHAITYIEEAIKDKLEENS